MIGIVTIEILKGYQAQGRRSGKRSRVSQGAGRIGWTIFTVGAAGQHDTMP